MSMPIPVVFELDSIGVGGASEAVAVQWYCSEPCREAAITRDQLPAEQWTRGTSTDHVNGTVCEFCGQPVPNEVGAQ